MLQDAASDDHEDPAALQAIAGDFIWFMCFMLV